MSADAEKDLRSALGETVGTAAWPLLEAHAKRGGLIFVDPSLELVDVAVAVAEDQTQAVTDWLGRGLLTKPSDEDIARRSEGDEEPFRFVIVQPFVLAQSMAG